LACQLQLSPTFTDAPLKAFCLVASQLGMGSCSAKDRKKLQRVVSVAQSIMQTSLPSIGSVYTSRCLSKAGRIIKDPTHPGHSLFHLLPSGKKYKCLSSGTSRLKNNFSPAAIRLLNGPASHKVDLSRHPSYECDTTFCTRSCPSPCACALSV